jgi:DNA modification methylase
MTRATLCCGDVRAVLAGLPERSVQTCITSPPYFGLRDYGHAGQIGLEASPAAYVEALVEVFRAVKRVLRDDGVVFLNLGDSYAAHNSGNNGYLDGRTNRDKRTEPGVPDGLKPKDLIGIPWTVAFALRADGWYLRSDIIWAKPNPMPESVTDRPTKSHEYLFLLSKSERYYWDAASIAEPGADPERARNDRFGGASWEGRQQHSEGGTSNGHATRNARSVWTIATQPYAGAHFATMPQELARRCILAGSSARACESCGAPWERVTQREKGDEQAHQRPKHLQSAKSTLSMSGGSDGWQRLGSKVTAESWQPTCSCEGNTGSASSVVLDPFGGSGTTTAVAVGHARRAIYVDLNPAYLELARQRIGPMFCDGEVAA